MGVMVAGLGAEFAVLPAPAASAIDDRTKIKAVAAQLSPNGVRSRPQFFQVRCQELGQIVRPVQAAA